MDSITDDLAIGEGEIVSLSCSIVVVWLELLRNLADTAECVVSGIFETPSSSPGKASSRGSTTSAREGEHPLWRRPGPLSGWGGGGRHTRSNVLAWFLFFVR